MIAIVDLHPEVLKMQDFSHALRLKSSALGVHQVNLSAIANILNSDCDYRRHPFNVAAKLFGELAK